MATDMNAVGSTVFIMIETKNALAAVEDIAAPSGADVLLVGSNDLASETGTHPDRDRPDFTAALQMVGEAARKNGQMCIAGLYHRPDILKRVITDIGLRDEIRMLLAGGRANSDLLRSLQDQINSNRS